MAGGYCTGWGRSVGYQIIQMNVNSLYMMKRLFFSLSLIFFLDVQSMNLNISIDSCDDHHN